MQGLGPSESATSMTFHRRTDATLGLVLVWGLVSSREKDGDGTRKTQFGGASLFAGAGVAWLRENSISGAAVLWL